MADDIPDPITAALDGLSPADAELCRRDILLYGSAFVRKLPDGRKVRVPVEDWMPDEQKAEMSKAWGPRWYE